MVWFEGLIELAAGGVFVLGDFGVGFGELSEAVLLVVPLRFDLLCWFVECV